MTTTHLTARHTVSSRSRSRRAALGGIAFAGMFVGSLIMSTVLGTEVFPAPSEPAAETAAYFADNQAVVAGMGVLQAIAAIPLMIFAFGALARAVPAGAKRTLVQAGGLAAGVLLMASGLIDVGLGTLYDTGDMTDTMHTLTFATGGALHVPFLGLMVGAGALGLAGSSPKWTTVLGVVSAALSLVSIISLAVEPATFLLPLGRFTGLLWIIITAIRLVRDPARTA